MQLHAPLRRTLLSPSATLKQLSIPLRPSSARLQTERTRADRLPNDRIMHALTLTYTLKLVEGGSITPVWQPLQRLVYDGPFEGHLWALYDSNKKQLCFGDVYGKAAKVPKGVCFMCVVCVHCNARFG